jgi:hypothetical protein
MLEVVLSMDLLHADGETRKAYNKNWIDLSNLSPQDIAEQSDTLLSHSTKVPIYLGYVDPLHMLSPYHETRLRPLLRQRHAIVLCSDPATLPFAWKNGIDTLIVYETTWRS